MNGHKTEVDLPTVLCPNLTDATNPFPIQILWARTHSWIHFPKIISRCPKKKKVKIEVNKIMVPAFLLGTAFNIEYWHRKYHSGTICKGVSNPQTSNALSGCEKEENCK